MNWERRAVLKGVVGLVGGAVWGGTAAGKDGTDESGPGGNRGVGGGRQAGSNRGAANQEVDTSLPPGVTLFDLNDDGAYTARVEEAPAEMRDDDHPGPIHVTSGGNSTVDYAASIAAPETEPTLGGLTELTYDYYEGPDNSNPDSSGGIAPDQTFVVVENDDGRHGAYLTYDAGGDGGQWDTFDVLARMRGDTAGSSRWFEYTAIEEGYDGQTFDNVVERFGDEALVVRVGVGHGNAVNPATLDVFYDNLVVNGTTTRFPTSVAKRVSNVPVADRNSNAPPF